MASKYIVLDSSAIIAFYNDEDANHADAVLASHTFREKIVVLHPYVVQEVVTVLAYRFSNPIAEEFLRDAKDAGNVLLAPVQIEKDIAYFIKAKRKMSFTDLALIRLAVEMNASLFTFDRQMFAFFRRQR